MIPSPRRRRTPILAEAREPFRVVKPGVHFADDFFSGRDSLWEKRREQRITVHAAPTVGRVLPALRCCGAAGCVAPRAVVAAGG
jgi:hypothetical protein